YDILSFDKEGEEKKIEVKATTIAKPLQFQFYISANEKRVAESNKNYYVYLVFSVNSDEPEIQILHNPFAGGDLRLEPIKFLVRGQLNQSK
ncbi:DUF3883 domain-containing protein, partial [Candidatus Parcubacteria bacterium]|nr:DUF3883 domain-containing protein [Candidatus Parcubacteria bacterium]